MRIRNHIRSNIIGYVALFFAFTASAVALPGVNTVFSDDIVNGEVKSADLSTDSVNGNKLRDNSTGSLHVIDNSLRTQDVFDDTLTGNDIASDAIGNDELGPDAANSAEIANDAVGNSEIATDAVGSGEIAADNVGSSEVAPNIVGADELDTVHEHTGTATDITDTTAHDGQYAVSTSTVSCGTGEDLLSVSVDWTDIAGHFETMYGGVDTITRGEPDTATVRVGFDGGAGPATYQAVATCIF